MALIRGEMNNALASTLQVAAAFGDTDACEQRRCKLGAIRYSMILSGRGVGERATGSGQIRVSVLTP